MRGTKLFKVIGMCALALLGVTACSDNDDVLAPPDPAAAAAVVIEASLTNVVDPLVRFVDAFQAALGARAAALGAVCPDTSNLCATGSVVCTVAGGYDFDFDECVMPTDAGALNLHGLVTAVDFGPSHFKLYLQSLVINHGTALRGTVEVGSDCQSAWSITGADGTGVSGIIDTCVSGYPDATSELRVSYADDFGPWLINFTFDGTVNAGAIVALDGLLVATCSVNVDTYDASCPGT